MSDIYLLRMTGDELTQFREQLLKEGASETCRSLGSKLKQYLSPYGPGACCDCGEQLGKEQYVSPESGALTEVVLEGFKAIESKQRVICRECLRVYYLKRGDNDPFPEDGPLRRDSRYAKTEGVSEVLSTVGG